MSLEDSESSLSQRTQHQLEEEFLQGIPMAYLMGFSEFYHHKFFVNQHVLIPRPETEYLVDLLVREKKGKVTRLLDVGTGSGIIPLSLLRYNVGKTAVAVDISEEALKVARINSKRLRLDSKIEFLLSDRLHKVQGTFDLIVSNPPYIKASSHRDLVHKSVDKHEPHQALYLPDDYYVSWYEDFFQEVRSHLNGLFMMEGHELELDNQAEMLKRLGFRDISILPDLTSTKRFLRAQYTT